MAERAIPQALDVEHFAQARIQELEFLDAAVAAICTDAGGGGGGEDGGPLSGGLRDQAQAVPRHMRRRTASHKPRRMPVAFKMKGTTTSSTITTNSKHSRRNNGGNSDKAAAAAANPEGSGHNTEVDATRCRKHRRRPRVLLAMRSPHAAAGTGEDFEEHDENRAQRGGGTREKKYRPRWLETHIWHAKRMHMREAWGFVLPAESNRGPRAVAEAALKHCTLQDVTFMRPVELYGPRWSILGVLSSITDPLDARATQQRSCVEGFAEARTHLYRVNQFPLGCIAPVSVMWSPPDAADYLAPVSSGASNGGRAEGGDGDGDDDGDNGDGLLDDARLVWLWVHPAAAREALREIRRACALEGSAWQGTVQAGPVRGGLCRLRVRGAHSHEIVQRVVRTAAEQVPAPAAEAAPDGGGGGGGGGGGFEVAARDNAAHWRALECRCRRIGGGSSSGTGGAGDSGGIGPRQLPVGSVLALSALDPRQQRHRQHRKCCPTSSGTPTPVASSKQIALPDPGEQAQVCRADKSATRNGSGGGGGREKSTKSRARRPEGASAEAEAEVLAATATAEQWPPRWAAVSPLWDPDARALSAELAAAHPDHVINEVRRRQRTREMWDNGNGSAAAAVDRATAKNIIGGRETSSEGGSSGRGGAAVPVILVSSSGVATTAHGEPGPAVATAGSLFDGDRLGGGGGGHGVRKDAERKGRAVAAGWDIILPPGWAPVFFRALVMAGARAISLKDADGLLLEEGEARFPADYPDTVAGRHHWDEVGRLAEAKWVRTRPKHRGLKLRLPPPAPPRPPLLLPLPLPSTPSGCGGEAPLPAAAAAADGGSGVEEVKAGAVTSSSGLEGMARGPKPAVTPSWLSSQFRPDFRSLAAGGLVMGSADVAAGCGVDASGEDTRQGGGEDEREPYAVARGFQYVRAFLPVMNEAPAAVDEEGDVRVNLPLSPLPLPPPPLRLAFPTVLELVIWQDKGVPAAGAAVHAASPEHHALWMQGRRDGKPWTGFSLDASPSPLPPPLLQISGDPLAVALNAVDADAVADGSEEATVAAGSAAGEARPQPVVIGAVTSGGSSILRGGGAGRAVCEAVAVRDALSLSLSLCRRQAGGVGGGGGSSCSGEELVEKRQRWPWALMLVGNKAGGWLRPAVAFVAAS